MKINTMRSYFTTDLDGSGQIVAVADSGLTKIMEISELEL